MSFQILRSINGIPVNHGEVLYTAIEKEMTGRRPDVESRDVQYTTTEREMMSLRPVAVQEGVRYTSTEAEMNALRLEMLHLQDDVRQIGEACC